MGGQAAEQIIAGVVLSERLAVTMYGAIHRAQFNGARNLRGLIVDPKMLADDAFRKALTDEKNVAGITRLEHGHIVPTVGVEAGGPDVVVVTRGVGRYVTVQDLLTSAKAGSKPGGKLSPPVAAAIGVAVIEALAAAHKAGVVHGAIHPRSVLIDEDGVVRLTDFVVGRALTTAVAQGADSALWRGLTGYIAPELVVGEDPTPAVDVFATGAMMFTMLSGEAPPGVLRVTPAIERLVSRALDTDVSRRYRSAEDLLENLREALEDDRWDLADRGELIREAGLSSSDSNVDEATEDLLASLGSADRLSALPIRPSVGLRAEAAAGKQPKNIDALLADLGDDATGMTTIDDAPRRPDPISEIIKRDPRERELLVSSTRVPSLDDPDDDEPPPRRGSDHERTVASRASSPAIRAPSMDEQAALAAIGELDVGAKRVNTAAEQAVAAAAKLEQAAQRAEQAARRVETGPNAVASAPRAASPIVDPIRDLDVPPVKLKSPVRGVIGGVLVLGVIGAAGYGIYWRFNQDKAAKQANQALDKKVEQDKAAREAAARNALPDPGAIDIDAPEAGVWLLLGTTPFDTPFGLPANQQHDLILLHDGYAPTPAQVNGTSWTGAKSSLKASVSVTLKPEHGKKGPPELPVQPTTPVLGTTGIVGAGTVHFDSTPPGAEVWLFIGADHARFDNLWAGRDYEVEVVGKGRKSQKVEFKADDWRDNDPSTPIDSAKKHDVLSKTVELEPLGKP